MIRAPGRVMVGGLPAVEPGSHPYRAHPRDGFMLAKRGRPAHGRHKSDRGCPLVPCAPVRCGMWVARLARTKQLEARRRRSPALPKGEAPSMTPRNSLASAGGCAAGHPCRRFGRLLEDEREHRGRQTPNLDVTQPEQISLEESVHAVQDHPSIVPEQQVQGIAKVGRHRPLVLLLVVCGSGLDLGWYDLEGLAVVAPVGQVQMPPEAVDRGRAHRELQAVELVGVPGEVAEHAAQLGRHEVLEQERPEGFAIGGAVARHRSAPRTERRSSCGEAFILHERCDSRTRSRLRRPGQPPQAAHAGRAPRALTGDLFRVREPGRVAATCGRWGSMPLSWADGGPVVTVVVGCDPVVRGPDVAQRSRAC
jgi:hypothetical protein